MRIAQLANFVGPASGGQQVSLVELSERYAAAGHSVLRIVPSDRDSVRQADGVRVVEIASRVVPGSGGYRIVTDARRADQLLEGFAPHVVELSDKTIFPRVARRARQRGAQVVLFSHERIDAILADRLPAGIPLRRLSDRWNRRITRDVDSIVCASEFAADEFVRIGASPVERIRLGVDLGLFTPSTEVVRAAPTIVTVGRLSREKRTIAAVEAMRHLRHPTARLMVIGDGPERSALELAATGLPVEFVGHVRDRPRLATLLRSASVAIAPCPHETFGLGALECLASGVPVVVPDAGALREVVTDTCGRVVRGDPSAYALAIDELLTLQPAALRNAARHRAEQFSWDTCAQAMLSIFARSGHPAERDLVRVC